uniref:Uncharacterized protein n=1 Tax=Anguilla anguilla TaxID=7936 RepID=A0A0E9TQ68_ANGAN
MSITVSGFPLIRVKWRHRQDSGYWRLIVKGHLNPHSPRGSDPPQKSSAAGRPQSYTFSRRS